jgi:hypothetical protein
MGKNEAGKGAAKPQSALSGEEVMEGQKFSILFGEDIEDLGDLEVSYILRVLVGKRKEDCREVRESSFG